mgnify:CR=1 FL=1
MAAKKPKKLTMPGNKWVSHVRVEFQWNGEKLKGALEQAVYTGITDGVLMMLEESQRLCPHDTGVLMRSGAWGYDKQNHVGSVSYGNGDAPYALFIHENPLGYTIHQGREDHWLQKTFQGEPGQRAARDLQRRIAEALNG